MGRKSEIVRGMGVALSLVQDLMAAVEALGGEDEDVHYLVTKAGKPILDAVALEIVGAHRERHRTLVDYDATLVQLLDAGHYDDVGFNIGKENFPVGGGGKCEIDIILFWFKRQMYLEEVRAVFDRVGFRFATCAETISLGNKHSELSLRFPIIGLAPGNSIGPSPSGAYRNLILCTWEGKRFVGVNSGFGPQGPDCRFAAVRK